MKQINNGYHVKYWIDEEGKVFDDKRNKYLKLDSRKYYQLQTTEGKRRSISQKKLYELVYHRAFLFDDIPNIAADEEWREIKGTHGYYWISNYARCKSFKSGKAKIIKGYVSNKGYEKLELKVDKERIVHFTHYFVATAFCEPPSCLEWEIHHKDFDKSNNFYKNLCFMEKSAHKALHAAERRKRKSCECTQPKENNHTENK